MPGFTDSVVKEPLRINTL